MSNNFFDYSRYYDLLYHDKDYVSEVDYIQSLISSNFSTEKCSLLELGCGTGIHAAMLAQNGYDVVGVDLSEEMLSTATLRVKNSNAFTGNVEFSIGDARTYRAHRTFDVVCALFHVLSYQTTNNDLYQMLQTASVHLNKGGIFIFDFWYGPAVLFQKPTIKTKRIENDKISVLRLAEPILNETINTVDVNYTIFITDKDTGSLTEIQETHKMRYLFLSEIDALLKNNGFESVVVEEWMTKKNPSINTWGVCIVAKKC